MTDAWEERFGLDPNVDDSADDGDGDNLSNLEEFNLRTDPTKADTDEDGLNDDVETNTGTFNSASDTGSNPNSSDTDRDGLDDGEEVNTHGTDPNNPGHRWRRHQ